MKPNSKYRSSIKDLLYTSSIMYSSPSQFSRIHIVPDWKLQDFLGSCVSVSAIYPCPVTTRETIVMVNDNYTERDIKNFAGAKVEMYCDQALKWHLDTLDEDSEVINLPFNVVGYRIIHDTDFQYYRWIRIDGKVSDERWYNVLEALQDANIDFYKFYKQAEYLAEENM